MIHIFEPKLHRDICHAIRETKFKWDFNVDVGGRRTGIISFSPKKSRA